MTNTEPITSAPPCEGCAKIAARYPNASADTLAEIHAAQHRLPFDTPVAPDRERVEALLDSIPIAAVKVASAPLSNTAKVDEAIAEFDALRAALTAALDALYAAPGATTPCCDAPDLTSPPDAPNGDDYCKRCGAWVAASPSTRGAEDADA